MKSALLFQCNSILPSAAEISTRGSTERLCSSSTFVHTMRSFITATLITHLGNHCQGHAVSCAAVPDRADTARNEHNSHSVLFKKILFREGKMKVTDSSCCLACSRSVYLCSINSFANCNYQRANAFTVYDVPA